MNKRKIFHELIEERSSGFKDLEKRISPDNLIYSYKNERIIPKDFRNYQNPIELFKESFLLFFFHNLISLFPKILD